MPRFIPIAALALALAGASVAAPAALPAGSTAAVAGEVSPAALPQAASGALAIERTGLAAEASTAVTGSIAAKYQTKVGTRLYSSASGTQKLASVPADYTVSTRTDKKSSNGTRVQVQYQSKTGWITLSKVSKVPLSTPLGKLSWKASASKNIARWCAGVPIDTSVDYMNQATASVSTSNGRRTVAEKIHLSTKTPWGTALDPNHPLAVSIQYHECGHIMQYRAYNYDFAALKRAMDKVYGASGNTAGGVEHMADCIAEALGAKRRGTETLSNGSTRTWVSGYGGTCTSTHLAAAKKIIAGDRV
ncbi:hypothetical protein NCCP1664_07180 [Zafaria cholistanensis]|uniref:Uncharacterized protein n=1 Tax=Zafaria cholistanensis TaxID=1682741 RepID=A0A5A7NQZ1_9MICC|nr:hypothetical protein [Zafaria cholistanensis]GER22221.1 hypothetical protein NCCP1664_07180 [Zafaria cholistanensis]